MKGKLLSNELLELLCCPKCHSSLAYNKAKNFLKCNSAKCSRTFKIEDSIPIMLVKD